jgi:glycosyltransferase involved in cell wall biosynthesis
MPVRDEAAYIARSLDAVLAQDYPSDLLEVVVADGMSTDGTREYLNRIAETHPSLRIVDNPGRTAPSALNVAIRNARGDVFVRVDGHCEVARDYVRRCVAHLVDDGVEAVGGPLETLGETWSARAIAAAMSSAFGVGGSAFRTVSGKTMLTDTVAFPAYTRAIVERAGPFDEQLVRNQDDEYNYRLRKLGAKVLLASDVRSRYYSRSSVSSLWRQYFQYGYWKVRVMQKHPRQMRPRQFVPAAFVATLLVLGTLAPFWSVASWALAGALGLYAVALLAGSVAAARRVGWSILPLLPVAFATLHVAYGSGFLVGLVAHRRRGWRLGAASGAASGLDFETTRLTNLHESSAVPRDSWES